MNENHLIFSTVSSEVFGQLPGVLPTPGLALTTFTAPSTFPAISTLSKPHRLATSIYRLRYAALRHRNIKMPGNAPSRPSSRLTQKSLSNLSLPPPAYSISICLPHSSIYTKNNPHHAHLGNWRSGQKSLSNSLSFNTYFTPIHAAGVGSSTASQYAEPCSGKQPILDAFVIRSIVPRPCTSIRWPHGHDGDAPTSWESCLSCCRVAVCIAPCRVIPDLVIAFGDILY